MNKAKRSEYNFFAPLKRDLPSEVKKALRTKWEPLKEKSFRYYASVLIGFSFGLSVWAAALINLNQYVFGVILRDDYSSLWLGGMTLANGILLAALFVQAMSIYFNLQRIQHFPLGKVLPTFMLMLGIFYFAIPFNAANMKHSAKRLREERYSYQNQEVRTPPKVVYRLYETSPPRIREHDKKRARYRRELESMTLDQRIEDARRSRYFDDRTVDQIIVDMQREAQKASRR